jgi:hypothetical protein
MNIRLALAKKHQRRHRQAGVDHQALVDNASLAVPPLVLTSIGYRCSPASLERKVHSASNKLSAGAH